MHRGLRRGDAGVHVRHLADRVLRAGALAPGLPERGLGREMLGARRRQRRHGGPLLRARFVERGVGGQHGGPRLLGGHGRRHPLRAGLVDLVLGHELLGQQRLEAREMVLGVAQLGSRTMQRRLGGDPLRFEPRDLGIGGDRDRSRGARRPPPRR